MHTFTLLQLSSVFCRFRFSWGNIWRDVERYEWRWLRNSSWAFVSIKHTSQPTKQSPTIYWSFHSLACFMVNWMISFAYTSKIFYIGCHHWCSSKVFMCLFQSFGTLFPICCKISNCTSFFNMHVTENYERLLSVYEIRGMSGVPQIVPLWRLQCHFWGSAG